MLPIALAPWTSHRHRRSGHEQLLAALLAALMLGVDAAGVSAKEGGLAFPADGVICDPAARACYDQQGLSLARTRATYGRKAEEQLRRQLGSAPPPREFRLSNGAVCSVPRRSCWEDGWAKGRVSQRLSRQLFGSLPNRIQDGRCQLRQSGRTVFEGPCDLRSDNRQGNTRYQVDLEDGRRFTFSNRNGRYELTSGKSNRPVKIEGRGKDAVFRWGDTTLVATRLGGSRFGASSNASGGSSLGGFLQQLFLPGLLNPGQAGLPLGPGSMAPGGAYGPMGGAYGPMGGMNMPMPSAPYPSPYPSGPYGNPDPDPYNSISGHGGGMGMPAGPTPIAIPAPGSCVTYGGWSDQFRLNLRPGPWLQVQAVDRTIAVVTPSGQRLQPAYGSGRWPLLEGGSYGVSLDVPPGEGLGVQFCLR